MDRDRASSVLCCLIAVILFVRTETFRTRHFSNILDGFVVWRSYSRDPRATRCAYVLIFARFGDILFSKDYSSWLFAVTVIVFSKSMGTKACCIFAGNKVPSLVFMVFAKKTKLGAFSLLCPFITRSINKERY